MGGAGGHMWHPFDCPDVNSGQDLINFFKKSIDAIKRNPAALKIDGVNLSFRLKENPGTPTGYEFVVDRGSMKPLDVEGVTADNADQRFVTRDGSPHGMVEATRILLDIFNAAIPEIMPELEQLGMTQQYDEETGEGGHFGLYFNTEFVLKKINVKEYPFNFIAIHGVNKFVPKGPNSRKGVGVESDQGILDQIRDKVQAFANERDFRVYTKIPANVNQSILLDDALNKEFTIVYKSFASDNEAGEMGAGEGSTKPLKAWLLDVSENPINRKVNISQKMREVYPKMGRSQSPYAKNIYLEVLKGTAVSDMAEGPEDVEGIVDGAVVMHATRMLGNAVLDALESEEFGSARDQEGVVVQDPEICGGNSFKFTGDFIVGGLATSFREAKYKTGPLLESFFPEPMPLKEQSNDKYVILIPGGFKPPTGGHYHMIKYYDQKPDVFKVLVVTGPKPREGVTLGQSKQIFDVYGGFSDKVDFIISDDASPMTTCYELLKNENFVNQFPNMKFSIGAGDKGSDPKRIQQFEQYFSKDENLKDLVDSYPPAKSLSVDGKPASASRLRKTFRDQDWENFKKLLPHESFYNEVVQILNNQESKEAVNENFLLALPQSFLAERKMTASEKRKDKKLRKKMDKAGVKKDFIKRYGEKEGKNIYFATIRKNAMTEQEVDPMEVLRNKIRRAVASVVSSTPELKDAKTGRINPSDFQPIVDSFYDQLKTNIDNNKKIAASDQGTVQADVADELKEVSGMAAGAVAGHMGGAWKKGDFDDE